jgi:hypothetical protein
MRTAGMLIFTPWSRVLLDRIYDFEKAEVILCVLNVFIRTK